MLCLDVADHRFDGGPPPHLLADRPSDPAHLAGDPDPELVRIVVAPIALVDMDPLDLDAGQQLHLGDHAI
jgi:hypothetical protein